MHNLFDAKIGYLYFSDFKKTEIPFSWLDYKTFPQITSSKYKN